MLTARYYDGRSARALPVRLEIRGAELLAHPAAAAHDDGTETLRWPQRALRWPERMRHGQRVIEIDGGGTIVADDSAAYDRWARKSGVRDGWVVRAQLNWRSVALALVLLVAVLAAGYRWGVPWAAGALLAVVPEAADRNIGDAAFHEVSVRWLRPSKLPAARQEALRAAFAQALLRAGHGSDAARWQLHFHDGGLDLGANAFALPGGHIVITDRLVQLLEGHDDTVIGVLAHEYGHVHRRHGMQALLRFVLLSAATSVVLGDFSSIVAAAPALLGQLGYSRDAEREADVDAARILKASGRSPAAMVVLFERLHEREALIEGRSARPRAQPPIALASHPLDDERIRYFEAAARASP